MSGATMFRRVTSATALLDALSDAMALRHEIGKAEDARLAQPARIVWVPVPNTRRQRECTQQTHYYEAGLVVYYEVSNIYHVNFRGLDVAACEELERRTIATMIEIGAWATTVELEGNGSLESNDNVAAEQGALIVWPIRLWTPLVHATLGTANINTVTSPVNAITDDGIITGTVP